MSKRFESGNLTAENPARQSRNQRKEISRKERKGRKVGAQAGVFAAENPARQSRNQKSRDEVFPTKVTK